MAILITGATGQLGRLVIDALLAKGTPAGDIVAGARTPSKAADLQAKGVRTVELDYFDQASIDAALDGIDTVLLISGSEPGNRFAGHKNVIDAASASGVAKLVYTSAPKATTADYALGADHRATELAIGESGIPSVILRNNWYSENYAQNVLGAADSGSLAAAVGDGRVASASRQDYAEAAAVVLREDGHIGRTYELAGDVAWDYDDLAVAVSTVVGRDVVYTRLTTEQLEAGLVEAGLDAGTAGFVAGIDTAIANGVLGDTDGSLAALIGRPTTPLVDGLRAAVTV